MLFLKSFPFGQLQRRFFRFQIYRNNRLIKQIGFYDPYTCRGGVNLSLFHFFLRKGLIIYDSRYNFILFLLLCGFNYSDLHLKFPINLNFFLKLQSPYKSKLHKFHKQFRSYKRCPVLGDELLS